MTNILEVKSEVIKRMQVKLEDWDHQLRSIGTKKKRNGVLNELISPPFFQVFFVSCLQIIFREGK